MGDEEGDPSFPPHVLREYSLLADGERAVLVGPLGDFAWMCVPRWDSDAVFSSLVGGSGVYAVTPTDRHFVWGGYYEDRSLIWRSRWVTTDGVVECREALAFPGDPQTAVVLRRVTAVRGPARVTALLDPRAQFGRRGMDHVEHAGGTWTARTGHLRLRWSGAGGAKRTRRGALVSELEVPEGGHHDLVLELSEQPLPDAMDPAAAWEATEAAWRRTIPGFDETLGTRDARHAYAVLRGLTRPGGGMVAAATTSLPERSDAGRNYDYRYAWIRDQCYAGQAVAVTEATPLLDDAVGFVASRLLDDGPGLRPAYRIDGGEVPDERSLPHLTGYPGGSDKVGNWVNRQFQLDSFGEALLLFGTAGRHDHLDSEHWRAVEAAVGAIESRWREPDAGIWEIDDQRWAHSRLMCVAGLRAVAAHASAAQAGPWSTLADAIAADAASDCLHPTGRWQRSPADPRVDAALLLAALRGAVPAGDPRSVATLGAVESELGREGYVYRYRHDDRPLGDTEGAFLLCGFLMALSLHQQHRQADAIGWFERNRSACGPSGLFTEEFDVRQRQLRGNLPQAFVHALLLESATRLARPWEAA
ncbi:MAG TPA: glycoside hydrolase family 15 protein [Acidimicrobiales bacterium]